MRTLKNAHREQNDVYYAWRGRNGEPRLVGSYHSSSRTSTCVVRIREGKRAGREINTSSSGHFCRAHQHFLLTLPQSYLFTRYTYTHHTAAAVVPGTTALLLYQVPGTMVSGHERSISTIILPIMHDLESMEAPARFWFQGCLHY